MKKYLLVLGLILSCFNCIADGVITTFSETESSYVESSLPQKARLYQVKLTEHYTFVTIELVATADASRLNYWYSKNTYVESGTAKLPLLGTYVKGTYHDCSYSKGWGWDNVKAGNKYYFTLMFSGRIPEGLTSFKLKDYASETKKEGWGYSFSNYKIKNPVIHAKRDEAYCKENALYNNDGICGIYEEIGGEKCRLACIKEDGAYYLIYLDSGEDPTWWFEGDTKAIMEESATLGLFKAEWLLKNKVINDETYLLFDGASMTRMTTGDSSVESSYMKMYPRSTSGTDLYGKEAKATTWSGTGFALNNSYIVTNYHVIDGAKTINIQSTSGDFTKKYEARVVASDKNNDLAILKVDGVSLSPNGLPYAVKTAVADVGEDVFVLGYPLTSTMGDELKLTTGVVSSKTGFQGDVSLYQISAPVQPGNSGGPLFDGNGNVIGIVSAKHYDAENVSYAIKASYLKNLMDSVLSTNVLPQTNKIAGYKLSDKVKYVRNYVYYITCSSAE